MKKTTFVVLFVALLALAAAASAALPSTVTVQTVKYGTLADYADAIITQGGNADLSNSPPTYLGWCVYPNGKLSGGIVTGDWEVYSSLGTVPAKVNPANWQAINYIINHKGKADKYQVQTAIWQVTNGGVGHGWQIDPNDPVVQSLLTDAGNNPTWLPGSGEKYGVILWQGEEIQSILIEVPIPTNSPEFPTLALPVAMLLGVVFTVYTIKTREDY